MANKFVPKVSKYVVFTGKDVLTPEHLTSWPETLAKAEEEASNYGEDTNIFIAEVIKVVRVKFPNPRYIIKDA